MTVIAWDKEYLVADGRSTAGCELVSDEQIKLVPVKHPEYGMMIGGFCGTVIMFEPWISHINENGFSKYETPDDEEYGGHGVVVRDDGIAFEIDPKGLWSTLQRPIAFGSGSTVAQHYLNGGSDALTAVREACKTNITCGGRLLAYHWRTNKFHSYSK